MCLTTKYPFHDCLLQVVAFNDERYGQIFVEYLLIFFQSINLMCIVDTTLPEIEIKKLTQTWAMRQRELESFLQSVMQAVHSVNILNLHVIILF